VGKIYDAMRRCVAECGESGTPFLCIEQFCEKLRTDDAWTGDEIEQVEQGAWRTMQAATV
jgi:hypothetical protein